MLLFLKIFFYRRIVLYKSVQRGKGIDKYSLIRKGLTDGYGFETVAKKIV